MAGLGLGSIASLGIGLAVYMDDQLSKVAKEVGKNLNALNSDAKTFNQSMARMESIGTGMAAIGDGVVSALTASSETFARFEDVMNSVKSIAQLGDDPAGMKMLTNQARNLGVAYGELPENVAKAQLDLAKAGKGVKEINNMTEAVMNLASASEMAAGGRGGASDILVNIMQQYSARSSEAGRYADVLTSAANRSTIDVVDFAESMKYSADRAVQMGIPIERAAAAIATLGNAGIKGSSAGTAYANMLRYLSRAAGPLASKNQQWALKSLGINGEDLLDATGQIKDLAAILDLFRKQSEGMRPNDKANLFQAIFGVRGDRAYQPLINGMVEDANGQMIQAVGVMSDGIYADVEAGIAKVTALEKLNDQAGDTAKMVAAWDNFKIGVGEALTGIVRPLLRFATGLLKVITDVVNSPFGQWLVQSTAIIGLLLSGVGRFIAIGAGFMRYIMTAGSTLRTTMQMATVASTSVRTNLTAGASSLMTAALAMRGITTQMMGAAGATAMLVAGGRLRGRSTGLTRTLGVIGGRGGIALGLWLTRLGASISRVVPWITRLGSGFGLLFKGLGWIFRGLFSWPVLIADIALTLLTGKGVFQWLWTAIKKFATMLGWMTEEQEEKKKENTFDAKRDYSQDNRIEKNIPKSWQAQQMEKIAEKNNITLNLTVNPVDGEKTKRTYNLQDARTLQSNSIN